MLCYWGQIWNVSSVHLGGVSVLRAVHLWPDHPGWMLIPGLNRACMFLQIVGHHLPQFTGMAPGGVSVPGILSPVRTLTHQQYPVDPEHCCGRKFPLASHCGTNIPMGTWAGKLCTMYAQRPDCLGTSWTGEVELGWSGTARIRARREHSARDTLSHFMVVVVMVMMVVKKWSCDLSTNVIDHFCTLQQVWKIFGSSDVVITEVCYGPLVTESTTWIKVSPVKVGNTSFCSWRKPSPANVIQAATTIPLNL